MYFPQLLTFVNIYPPILNLMPTRFIVLALLLAARLSFAQLIIGTPGTFGIKGKEVDTETMQRFKKTTTVFFYNEEDAAYFEDDSIRIKRNWKITPLFFVPVSRMEEFTEALHGTYSFLDYHLTGSVREHSYVQDSWAFLDLRVPVPNGEFKNIARLALGPETKDAVFLSRFYLNDQGESERLIKILKNPMQSVESVHIDRAVKYLQTKASFTNFYPGIFRYYLGYINNGLEAGETRGINDSPTDDMQLSALAEGTLIVPESILLDWDKRRKKFEALDPGKLFSKYDYKYKVLSAYEINDLFLSDSTGEGLFIMVPALSSGNQFINIYTPDGKWVYSDWEKSGGGFDARDIKEISKRISKAVKD